MTPAPSNPPFWARSKSTGNLFLRRRRKVTLGMVFTWPDGTFGFRAGYLPVDEFHYSTEEAAIEALYAVLGI